MKRISHKVYAVLMGILLLTGVFANVSFAADGDGSGGGGGDKPVSLTSASVTSVTKTTATVVFVYSNNVGTNASNKDHVHVKSPTGGSSTLTVSSWADASSPRKRELQANLTNLTPGASYVVWVTSGVVARNGNACPDSREVSFTTPRDPAKPPSDSGSSSGSGSSSRSQGGSSGSGSTGSGSAGAGSSPKSQAPQSSPPGNPGFSDQDRSNAQSKIQNPNDFPSWDGTGSAAATGSVEATAARAPGSGGGSGGGKDKPLELVRSTPKDGQRDVPLSVDIKMEFSKNVVYLEVRDANKRAFSLWDGEREVPIEIIMADDQIDFEERNNVTVHPTSSLEKGKRYVVKIDQTLTAKSGASLAEPTTITFYTEGYTSVWVYVVGGVVVVALLGTGAYLYLRKKKLAANASQSGNTPGDADTAATVSPSTEPTEE